MKQYLTIIIFLLSLISCSQRIEDNNSGLTLILKYDNPYTDIEQLKTIIEQRLTDYGITSHKIKFTESSLIHIEIPETTDSLEIISLLCANGQFQIKETFDNTVIFEYLENLNKDLHDKGISSSDTSEYIKEHPLLVC